MRAEACLVFMHIKLNLGYQNALMRREAQLRRCMLGRQAVQILRLKGYVPDVDTLGTLVWARTPAGVWWPGEALDPFHMPPTRVLPLGAAAGGVMNTAWW
jgi:hypothetical protein